MTVYVITCGPADGCHVVGAFLEEERARKAFPSFPGERRIKEYQAESLADAIFLKKLIMENIHE